MTSLKRAVRKVVDSGNCSGCGACTNLSRHLEMRMTDAGYLRPFWSMQEDDDSTDSQASLFKEICPGRLVRAQPQAGRHSFELLGSYESLWRAHAIDEDARHRGSSGGVIHTIASWLLDSGQSHVVSGTAADTGAPVIAKTIQVRDSNSAASFAGSRYQPASGAAKVAGLSAADVHIGKPCEASAVRALRATGEAPLLLSFFCAGTPSQHGTDRVLGELGVAPDTVRVLRYRGDGWPGFFTAETSDGHLRKMSYQDSWGNILGRSLQWRCKICPDGLAESADIVAGDLWETDESGYPTFIERAGVSAVIARTARGDKVLREAIKAGVIWAEPVTAVEILGAQPSQVERKRRLVGRLLGTIASGRPTPKYRGLHILWVSRRNLIKSLREAYGTRRRARRADINA